MVIPQSDVSALKETLSAQQKLLQKLYHELDEERESSATAASEALSVILRLQGEKAAIKMEAEQYKRLAEEKMCHAEESMELIEDIIYQKEMEVASLDYQVQAYRYKLMSLGCADPGVSEIKIPDNLLQRNEALVVTKRNHTPPHKFKKGTISRESSISHDMDLSISQEVSDSECIISYGEQIKKLDERIKEIAGVTYTNFENEEWSPPILSSRPSASNLQIEGTRPPSPQYDSKKLALLNEINQFRPPAIIAKHSTENFDYSSSSNVYDVFEVPQVDESLTKDKKKSVCLDKEEAIVKPYAKDEPDWLKKLLQSSHKDNSLCKPSDIAAKGGKTRATISESQTKMNQLNNNASEIIESNSSIDGQVAILETSSTSVSEHQTTRTNQVNMTSEIIDSNSSIDGQFNRTSEIEEVEGNSSSNREEEMKLLNEIKDRLSLLQDEIRSLKVKKSFTKNEENPSLVPLSEAMTYFWL